MQVWRGLEDVPGASGRSVVTIGVFDGVHRGHQRLVARATGAGAAAGLPVVAVTFDPHPDEVVRPGTRPTLLCSVRRRAELLGELGVGAVCVLPFTYEFSRQSPDEFVRSALVDRLHAARVVIGETFRFGHKAAGDLGLLTKLGENYEFTAEGVPLLIEDGITISSSYIRERLAAGDVEAAARALGRPHRVEGVVVRGHRRGRALGFPTANLEWPAQATIPADGVYAGWLMTFDPNGRPEDRWPAAVSIGTNPTFDDGYPAERSVEAYALGRDDLDLYGARAAVDFAARLRSTEKFASVDELVTQMHRDADLAHSITQGGGFAPHRP